MLGSPLICIQLGYEGSYISCHSKTNSVNSRSGFLQNDQENSEIVAKEVVGPKTEGHTDLKLLHSHRLSHAAETGQLVPRARRRESYKSWQQECSTRSLELPQQLCSNDSSSAPPSHRNFGVNDPNTVTDSSNERLEHPLASAVNEDKTLQPSQLSQDRPENFTPIASLPILPHTVVTEQNVKRTSEILRKVNSGFEILRPGTLNAGNPEEPMLEATEKRQSRRLQKRRRSSSVSVSIVDRTSS